MRLYLITREAHGENLDTFAVADNAKEAVGLWRAWDLVQAFELDTPDRVFEVQAGIVAEGPARLLDWHSNYGVQDVQY